MKSLEERPPIWVAMAFILIIPVIVLVYLAMRGIPEEAGDLYFGQWYLGIGILTCILILAMGLASYIPLREYRLNIIRVRDYLQDIVKGELPDDVALLSAKTDFVTIQECMKRIVDIQKERIATLEREKRQLEKQRYISHKLESFGRLTRGITHDFNNMLDGILGNAGLALMDLPADSPIQQNVEDIRALARRMAILTDEMLTYSGAAEFATEVLDVSRLVKGVEHLLNASITKNATLEFDLDENVRAIECDPSEIRYILAHLVTNASDALGNGSGIIKVSTGVMECDRAYLETASTDDSLPEGTYVYIEVSDTGCGMDPETASKICEPFFTMKAERRGFGLTAVSAVTDRHKGTMKVSSKPGKGSTFRVLFPVSEKTAELPSEKEKAPKGEWGDGRSVLVIDDEGAVRNVARATLKRAGFKVLTAANGDEGIDVFHKHAEEIVLVMLDVTMPGMRSSDVFSKIGLINKDVPIALCSGHIEEEAINLFSGRKPAGFIHKPHEPEDLVDKIWEILAKRQGL